MNSLEIMCSVDTKYIENLKQQFLMHLTYILCKISVIEYSYLSFNSTII
jgi:hypothetical protein